MLYHQPFTLDYNKLWCLIPILIEKWINYYIITARDGKLIIKLVIFSLRGWQRLRKASQSLETAFLFIIRTRRLAIYPRFSCLK